MKEGLAPIGYDGKPVNLHHMDQTDACDIAEVADSYHKSNYSTLHTNTGQSPSKINRKEFNNWRKSYWRYRSHDFDKNMEVLK